MATEEQVTFCNFSVTFTQNERLPRVILAPKRINQLTKELFNFRFLSKNTQMIAHFISNLPWSKSFRRLECKGLLGPRDLRIEPF